MNVLLINPPTTLINVNGPTIYPPMGLAYISAVLEKEGINCNIVDLNLFRKINVLDEVKKFNPKFIGISVNISSIQSAIDICNNIINKIEKTEKSLCALAHFDKEKALERCSNLSKGARKGELWGIPIFIKDNICVQDEPTTCASHIRTISPYSYFCNPIFSCSFLTLTQP